MNCANCKKIACLVGSKRHPDNCPMDEHRGVYDKARKIYEDPEIKEMALNSNIVEAEGYNDWPRIKDTIEFMKRMHYKKIGLAFCIGLMREAEKIQNLFTRYGFEVASIMCKTGAFTKAEVGNVPEEYNMVSKTGYQIGFVSCNPVAQALLLNAEKTEFNVLVGLCVGHDSLFIKHSEAPVTVLITKDRRLSHNPAAALYTYYYDKYFHKDVAQERK